MLRLLLNGYGLWIHSFHPILSIYDTYDSLHCQLYSIDFCHEWQRKTFIMSDGTIAWNSAINRFVT